MPQLMPLFWIFYFLMFCFLMGMLIFLYGGFKFLYNKSEVLVYEFPKSLWCW